MERDKERLSFKSLISTVGNKKTNTMDINQDISLLTYLLRPQQEEAFFLLEGIREGSRFCKVVQFIIKPGTNDIKAEIKFQDVGIEALQDLCAQCVGFSAELKSEEVDFLINLVEAEVQRSKVGLINYIRLATSANGPSAAGVIEFFSTDKALASSQASVVNSRVRLEQALLKIPDDDIKKKILTASHYCAESLVKLFVPGHNSRTWTEAILRSIQLSPEHELRKIVVNLEDINPDVKNGCAIF